MNIIEALYISLGLDSSEYDKKRKDVEASLKKFGEASDKQTKLIAESGKKAAGAFSALKIEILGALAAFGMGAGFKDFIESSMNMQVAAGRQAAALGVSVNSLQVWKQMAVNMGESGDAAVTTLQKVAQGMAAARRGDMSFITNANQYGAGITINDNTETVMSKLNRMAYAIKQKYGTQQAMSLLGEVVTGDLGQQTLLMKSQADFAAFRADAKKHAVQLTQQEIDQNGKLLQQVGDLRGDFGKIQVKLENQLLPVVIKLAKEFEEWLDKWIQGGGLDRLVKSIGNFIDKVQSVVKEMGGWKVVAEALGAILALKVLSPLTGIAGSLLKLLPLFTGAATGVSGLAAAFGSLGVALAGVAGYWAGSEIWMHTLEGTKAGDALGSFEARMLAFFGNQDARDAINRMNGKGSNGMSYYHPERTAWVKQREAQALDYFTSQAGGGYSRAQAAGIVGNLMQESMLDPNSVNKTSGARGIAQWLGGRAQLFEKIEGVPLQGSSFQKQLDFVRWELAHTENRTDKELRQTTATPNATLVFGSMYERFGDDGSWGKRVAYANSVLSNGAPYVGAKPSTQVAKSGGDTKNDVHIQSINVQTQAMDANGIVRDIRKAFHSNPLIQGSVTAAS